MIRVLMIFGAPVLAMFYFAGFVDTFGGSVSVETLFLGTCILVAGGFAGGR